MDAAEFSRRFRVSYPSGALVPPNRYVSQRVFEEAGPLHYKALLYTATGQELVIRVTAAAVRKLRDGSADLVVSVLHDVTDAESLERLYDQFFAAAAHALKTPVAIIKANVEFVSRDGGPKIRRSAAAIERQCSRIDLLVQNLLVVSRARSKSLTLHPAELALRPLVERVAAEIASFAPRHDLRMEIAASPVVHGDPERIALALRNLVADAIRDSQSGAPLSVLLDARGFDARIGVRHQPLPPDERLCAVSGEYDDSTLGRCATETIVEAHGGTLLEDVGPAESITWMRLPAIKEAA
jgi:signal transduction histidine kinase